MIKDAWTCAWRELGRRKSRTIANIFGYLLAVSATLILVCWVQFTRKAADEVLTTVGTHFIAFVPSSYCCPERKKRQEAADKSEGFIAVGGTTELIPANLVEKVKQLPTVKDASPYLSFRFRNEQDGHLFTIGGFDPDRLVSVGSTTCAPTDLVDGRFLNGRDRGVAMIEKSYADSRGLQTGDKMRISGRDVTVIGIVAPATRPAKSDVYLHIKDAEDAINRQRKTPFHYSDFINIVLVEVKSSRLQDQAIASVKQLYPKLEVNGFACYRPAAKVMGLNEKAILFLTILIGLSAVLFAAKSQFASVLERQRDIGILKAVGWSNRNIVFQILTESVVQALIGGIIGCALAVNIVYLVPLAKLSGIKAAIPMAIDFPTVLAAFVLSLAGGSIAGIFPALSAARKNPADALRRG